MKEMTCPHYKDNTRECVVKIKVMPRNTYSYCTSEKFSECPFYRHFTEGGPECVNVQQCRLFAKFMMSDFGEFVKMANDYCFSGNYVNCTRIKLKNVGETVPDEMFPDGSIYRDGEVVE